MSTKIYDVYIADKTMYEVFTIFAELRKKHIKTTHPETIDMIWRNNNEPLKIEVVIIPLSNRRTIVKPIYGGYEELSNTVVANEIKEMLERDFKDYHYQNSTDRPDDISPQEWNARKMNWDRLSDTYGLRYSDMGVVYTVWQPDEVKIRKSNR